MAADQGPWGALCHLLPPPVISGHPSGTPGGGGMDGSISKCAHLGANNKERLSQSVPPTPPAHSTFSLRPGCGELYAALSETPDRKLSLQGEGLSILPSPRTRGLSNSEEGREGQGWGGGRSCWKGRGGLTTLLFLPFPAPMFSLPHLLQARKCPHHNLVE